MFSLRNLHLWSGLLASIIIFLEAITGLLLVHTNWLAFDKQITHYESTSNPYTDHVDIAQALIRVSQSDKFNLDEVRLIMNHSLGDGHYGGAGDYKVRLKDAAQTLYVFDTKGNLVRKEINATNNWIRDFHYGEIFGRDITWLIDIAAIVIIFLTLSGTILFIQELRLKNKSSKHKDRSC